MRLPGTRGRAHPDNGRPASREVKIAFLGPLPPSPTGIATYDRAVLDGLARIGFEIPVEPVWPVRERHFSQVPGYLLGVYQLGNNAEHHLPIYRMVWQTPGIAVLHDLAMDDFIRALQTLGDPLGFAAVREALEAREKLVSPDILRIEPLRVPWPAAVARRARGVIVHSEFCRRYLEEAGVRTPIFVVPHPPVESREALARGEARGRELRAKVEGGGGRQLVVAPGDMNEAKCLDAVLAAAARLPEETHVVVVGRRVPTYDFGPVAHASGLGHRLHVEHDVSDDDFLGWLFAADVVVDLRHPHRGEVSGSLVRAMEAGRPAIVSDIGTYADLPDGLVAHVAPGPPDPAELAHRIAELSGGPGATIGARARAHMEAERAGDATARGYADAIRSTLRVVYDPVGPAMARWARAMVEMGADQEVLDTGYGLKYARALEGFKR
jgi:glycosyltransferase involved in cell wall biosynthesis